MLQSTVRRAVRFALLGFMGAVYFGLTGSMCFGRSPVEITTPGQPDQEHLDRLAKYRSCVVNPDARPEERRNWAEVLIDESLRVRSKESFSTILQLLELEAGSSAHRAICEAMIAMPSEKLNSLPVDFIEPLIALLDSPDASMRSVTARALSIFKGQDVIQRLGALAGSSEESATKRLAAIDALTPNIHVRGVVAELIRLLKNSDDVSQNRILAALAPASREAIGFDIDRWMSWWETKSKLSEREWLDDRLDMYRNRVTGLESQLNELRQSALNQQNELSNRLRDFQREAFRSLPGPQRDTKLVEWLNDVNAHIQLTALAIIKGRISDEAARPTNEVLSVMLKLLEHGTQAVRSEVITIVQNLNDPLIPPAVLQQLTREHEISLRALIVRACGKLGIIDAVPTLSSILSSMESHPVLVQEAAMAIGDIARQADRQDQRLREAVNPLKLRYEQLEALNGNQPMHAALLTGMAGIADSSFTVYFREALESQEPTILRPAIRGLYTTKDASKLPRLRRLTANPDPLVRLEAIEAVGKLGQEEVDLEALAARLNPTVESNELTRDAAWRGFRALLRMRPARDQIAAADMLRDLPHREADYLMEIASALTNTDSSNPEKEMLLDRLSLLLLAQNRHAQAVPYLRVLYYDQRTRSDVAAQRTGPRLLEALLFSESYSAWAPLLEELAASTGTNTESTNPTATNPESPGAKSTGTKPADSESTNSNSAGTDSTNTASTGAEAIKVESAINNQILEVVASYLNSSELITSDEMTRKALSELKTVTMFQRWEPWRNLLQTTEARLPANASGEGDSP